MRVVPSLELEGMQGLCRCYQVSGSPWIRALAQGLMLLWEEGAPGRDLQGEGTVATGTEITGSVSPGSQEQGRGLWRGTAGPHLDFDFSSPELRQ